MAAHTKEEFNVFLAQLKETNQTLDFFCDFEKINQNHYCPIKNNPKCRDKNKFSSLTLF